jgi:hypothetical protein
MKYVALHVQGMQTKAYGPFTRQEDATEWMNTLIRKRYEGQPPRLDEFFEVVGMIPTGEGDGTQPEG